MPTAQDLAQMWESAKRCAEETGEDLGSLVSKAAANLTREIPATDRKLSELEIKRIVDDEMKFSELPTTVT